MKNGVLLSRDVCRDSERQRVSELEDKLCVYTGCAAVYRDFFFVSEDEIYQVRVSFFLEFCGNVRKFLG